jgi:ABC-2 type transport system permease protein
MRRYFKLFSLFFINNLARETEFRGNFLILIILDLIWVVFQVITIELFFSFTTNIAGWTRYSVYAFIGIFRMVKGFFDAFCRRNLHSFPDSISRGDLDYSLTRPINTLFLMSTRYHAIGETTSIFLGLALFVYAIRLGSLHLNPFTWVVLPSLIISGVIVFYSLILLFVILSIFTVRLTALRSYYEVFSQTLRFPTDVYLGHGRVVDTLILPLILMATLPSKIILGTVSIVYVPVQLVLTGVLFTLVYRFWHFALRHYSSASS